MAATNSFDIVSILDFMEMDNAINQTEKEIQTRYDFKGSKTELSLNKKDKKLTIHSDDEFKLKAVVDILQSRMIKRGISIKCMVAGKIEQATMGSARQTFSLISGLDKEQAKEVTKVIKDSGVKVQAQINDDLVRVTGKSRDDLQDVIKLLKEKDLAFPVQFVNYR
ncbi:MAG: YajQ family cyclic di-GMP-binding protein [Bacteroidetes bacterium]|nr:YajQ family cyclic di-GMP-binding protein [Bacteroidota bacterium]